MRKTWVLDTETKGTGANVVPLERIERKPQPAPKPARRTDLRRREAFPDDAPPNRERPLAPAQPRGAKTVSALPPGHVRKKSTGEIGQVRSVDPEAGTATVRWLRGGATSTVPLSAISRR
jgi:hypothetical protein